MEIDDEQQPLQSLMSNHNFQVDQEVGQDCHQEVGQDCHQEVGQDCHQEVGQDCHNFQADQEVDQDCHNSQFDKEVDNGIYQLSTDQIPSTSSMAITSTPQHNKPKKDGVEGAFPKRKRVARSGHGRKQAAVAAVDIPSLPTQATVANSVVSTNSSFDFEILFNFHALCHVQNTNQRLHSNDEHGLLKDFGFYNQDTNLSLMGSYNPVLLCHPSLMPSGIEPSTQCTYPWTEDDPYERRGLSKLPGTGLNHQRVVESDEFSDCGDCDDELDEEDPAESIHSSIFISDHLMDLHIKDALMHIENVKPECKGKVMAWFVKMWEWHMISLELTPLHAQSNCKKFMFAYLEMHFNATIRQEAQDFDAGWEDREYDYKIRASQVVGNDSTSNLLSQSDLSQVVNEMLV